MAPQVSRLLVVFICLALVFLGLRAATVPSSFGKKGFYRADALKTLAALPIHHAGRPKCLECHEKDVKTSLHVNAGIGCESCHGPSEAHVLDPHGVKPPRPHERSFCGSCHAQTVGRKGKITMQNMKDHNPGTDCTDCHQFHAEELPK